MRRFEHGGDIYRHPGTLDFSANLNPLGVPRQITNALRDAVESFDVYPDPVCEKLAEALAEFEGVEERQVLVTAGATDLMTRTVFALKPQRALVVAPCYSGYEQALEQGEWSPVLTTGNTRPARRSWPAGSKPQWSPVLTTGNTGEPMLLAQGTAVPQWSPVLTTGNTGQ